MTTTVVTPPSTDLVVVLPGIMGSVLGQATATKRAEDNLVWAPTGGAAVRAVRNFLGRAPQLALPDGVGDEHPDDSVVPVALMPDLHVIPGLWTPIRGYDDLLKFLNRLGYQHRPSTRAANLLPVPYDWRLSNRYNGQLLAGIVEPALDRWRAQGGQYQDAQVVFVCHSMGGLVARWYIEKCGGAEITRKLITLGTPWRGAGMAVDKLSNGVPVKIGPIDKIRLDVFSRSLPSLYQLLPEYACIAAGRDYLKTTETSIPELQTARVADVMSFYIDLQQAERDRPASKSMTHMLVGSRQPTITTFTVTGGRAVPSETFGTVNDYGDGTVPLTGAVGHDEPLDSNEIHRVADQHGNLQCNTANFDEITGIITAKPIRRRDRQPHKLRVTVPDLIIPGEDLPVTAQLDGDYRAGLRIAITNEAGQTVQARQPRIADGEALARFTGLPPGAYTVTIDGTQPGLVSPVTAATLVWDPATT
jgi:pimeloyl-ACP methyl ester carboxylesterase